MDLRINPSSKKAFDLYYKSDLFMTIKFENVKSMEIMLKTLMEKIDEIKNKYDQ